MKKQNILLSVLSIACLVGCTSKDTDVKENGDNSNNNDQQPVVVDNNFKIDSFGTAKFEAEKFDLSKWTAVSGDKVVDNANASGGKYLAAGKAGSKAEFNFTIKDYSKVVFSAAFAQREGELDKEIAINDVIAFHVDAINDFRLDSSKKIAARDSAADFELVTYGDESLYGGTYKVTVEVKA